METQPAYLIMAHYLLADELDQGIKYGNFNISLHKKGTVIYWFEWTYLLFYFISFPVP